MKIWIYSFCLSFHHSPLDSGRVIKEINSGGLRGIKVNKSVPVKRKIHKTHKAKFEILWNLFELMLYWIQQDLGPSKYAPRIDCSFLRNANYHKNKINCSRWRINNWRQTEMCKVTTSITLMACELQTYKCLCW